MLGPGKLLRMCFIGREADDFTSDVKSLYLEPDDQEVDDLVRQVKDEVAQERQFAIDREVLEMPRVPCGTCRGPRT